MAKRPVEDSLRKLQGDMRSNRMDSEDGGRALRLDPSELTPDGEQMLRYDRQTANLIRDVEVAVQTDLWLEHLGDEVADEVWKFACLCYLERSVNQVPVFLKQFDQELRREPVLFPVHNLSVDQPFDFAGAPSCRWCLTWFRRAATSMPTPPARASSGLSRPARRTTRWWSVLVPKPSTLCGFYESRCASTMRSMIVNYGSGWARRQHLVRRTRSEGCQLARATRLTSSPTCATSSPTTSSPLSHPTPRTPSRSARCER
jgi:hypothetical protein